MHPASPPSFAIECACGTRARGERLPKHQIITCTHCGRSLFVFPNTPSPFAGGSSVLSGDRAAWRERAHLWLPPAVAGLAGLALGGVIVFATLQPHRPAVTAWPPLSEDRAARVIADRLEAA